MEVGRADQHGDWLWKQQDALCHRLRVSAAYHSRRERFFDLAERWFQAFAALSATAAFAQIAGDPGKDAPARWFALCAAVASIAPLVFGFAAAARNHGQLKAGFKRLLSDVHQCGIELTEAQLTDFRSRTTALEAGEPAPLAALCIQCENDIAASEGKKIYPLRRREWLLMHFYSFDGSAIVGRTAGHR